MAYALLIIDVQHGFIPEYAEGLDEKIAEFSNNFKNVGVVQYINTPYSACAQLLNWQDCQQGSPEAELLPAIVNLTCERENVPHFIKHTYSAATDDVLQWLHANNITGVILVGASTTCCVLATAYALFDKGYDVCVVSDLCVSSTEDRNEAALKALHTNVSIATSKEVLEIFAKGLLQEA